MDPLTVLSIAGTGLQAGHQLISSFQQKKKADELEKSLKRPTYAPPTAAQEALGMARTQALSPRIPGQSAMEDAVRGNAASSLEAITKGGAGSNAIIAGATAVNQGANTAMGNINTMANQQNERDQMNLQRELGRFSTLQDQAWEYNQKKPYEEGAAAQAALREASNRNLSGSIGAFSGLASAASGLIGQGEGATVAPGTPENPVTPDAPQAAAPEIPLPQNPTRSIAQDNPELQSAINRIDPLRGAISRLGEIPDRKPTALEGSISRISTPEQERFQLNKDIMMRANVPRPELFSPVKPKKASMPEGGNLYDKETMKRIAGGYNPKSFFPEQAKEEEYVNPLLIPYK